MVDFIHTQKKRRKKTLFLSFFCIDALDNEWLGQGFQERLSSLERAIAQVESPDKNSKSMSIEKPTIVISQAVNSDRSIHAANEEYEQLFQSIQMLVK